MKNSLEIIYLQISAVKPSPYTARHHDQRQRQKLKSLIKKYGQIAPIIVDAGYVIVDGHAVYDALLALGYEQVAVVVVANRSEADVRGLRLALNRIGQDTKWDSPKLKSEFQALMALGFDLEITGFNALEIDMALSIDAPADDASQEPTIVDHKLPAGLITTKPGDIWHLNQQTVACGDVRDNALLHAVIGEACVAQEFNAFTGDDVPDGNLPGVDDGLSKIPVPPNKKRGVYETEFGTGKFYWSKQELILFCVFEKAHDRNNAELNELELGHSNIVPLNRRIAETVCFSNGYRNESANLAGKGLSTAIKVKSWIVLTPIPKPGVITTVDEPSTHVCVGVEVDPARLDDVITNWQGQTGRVAINAATGETFATVTKRLAAAMSAASSRSDRVLEEPTASARDLIEEARNV